MRPLTSRSVDVRTTVRRCRRWLGDQAARWSATVRFGRLPTQRPLPRVRVRLGPWVPALVLRGVQVLVALACVALVAPGPGWRTVAVLGALLLVVRPSGIVAGCYAFALGFGLAVSSSSPWSLRSFALLLGLHLLVELARQTAGVPWATHVDLRVLVPAGRRFLPVQALAQLLALGGAGLSSTALTVPWLPVLVGVALTLLAWAVLRGLLGPDRTE